MTIINRSFLWRIVLASLLFFSSVFIISIKLLNPPQIQIVLEDYNITITNIQNMFTFNDVLIIMGASILLGASGAYLLLIKYPNKSSTSEMIESRKAEWRQIAKTLKSNERIVYEAIIESEGIIDQSELTSKTGLSKATVSRVLDLLESKGLVEKKRRGMRNTVILK